MVRLISIFYAKKPIIACRHKCVTLYNPPSGSNKKAQLSLTNPRDDCEKFARFT